MLTRAGFLAALAVGLVLAGSFIRTDDPNVGIAREVSAEDLDALGMSIQPTDVEPAVSREEALRTALAFHHGEPRIRGVSYGSVRGRPSWMFTMDPRGTPSMASCPGPSAGAGSYRCPRYETVAAAVVVDAMTGSWFGHYVARPVAEQASLP